MRVGEEWGKTAYRENRPEATRRVAEADFISKIMVFS